MLRTEPRAQIRIHLRWLGKLPLINPYMCILRFELIIQKECDSPHYVDYELGSVSHQIGAEQRAPDLSWAVLAKIHGSLQPL